MNTTSVSRRFTEIDLLMVSVWVAFSLVFGLTPNHGNQFICWVVAGGPFIADHMYSVVYKGEESQGDLQLATLAPVSLMIAFKVFGVTAAYVNSMTPITYDAFLSRWDFGIAATVRDWSAAPWLINPLVLVYKALPLFLLASIAVSKGHKKGEGY